MSNSRKPGEADNEKAMRAANELDVELSRALDSVDDTISEIDRIDETVRSATPQLQIKPGYFITEKEYESLNATSVGGFFRSFAVFQPSADVQKQINLLKTDLHGCGTDEERYAEAVKQRDSIYDKITAKKSDAPGAPKMDGLLGALKQYADKLDTLIQNANTRALAAQHQARQKK